MNYQQLSNISKFDNRTKKGIILAIIAAIVSSFSILFNKEGIKFISDSDVFIGLKSIIVVLILSSLFIISSDYKKILKLEFKDWIILAVFGLIGGSIPFILFFKGLALSESAFAPAFIQKTIFIWASILAVIFLKEKIGKIQIAALFVLIISNLLILGLPKNFNLGFGEILIFIATIIWSFENILVKKILTNFEVNILIFGRMFFGSIFLIVYLLYSGKILQISRVDGLGWIWIIILSVMLFGYITFWYSSLKYANVSLVTSVLVIASPLTSLYEVILKKNTISLNLIIGIVLVIISILAIYLVQSKAKFKWIQSKQKVQA